MNMVAFVPAKGHSNRIPCKNRQELSGLPLFLRACYNLNQVLSKKSIYVDSDDGEMLDQAKDHGFNAMIRPASLATNATDGNAFFRWETSQVPSADVYIQHLPPMPFLAKETLQSGIQSILSGRYDSIVPVAERHSYLWDEKTGHALYDLQHIPNSIDLPTFLEETMGLYMIRADVHRETGLRIGNKPFFLKMSVVEQIDIDYPEDLELARAIERGLSDGSEYKSAYLMEHGCE